MLLLVGDSQALGPPGTAFVARRRGEAVLVLGREGRGPADFIRDARTSLEDAAARATEVVYWFGVNDPPSEETARAFAVMRQITPRAWLVGPPRYATEAYERRSIGLAQQGRAVFGWRFVDSRRLTSPTTGRAADQVHFTTAGGAAWAEAVVRQMRAQTFAHHGAIAAAVAVGVAIGYGAASLEGGWR